MQINQQLYSTVSVELLTGEKSVSRHEETSADGGSFAEQGGLIGKHIGPFVLVRSPVAQLEKAHITRSDKLVTDNIAMSRL